MTSDLPHEGFSQTPKLPTASWKRLVVTASLPPHPSLKSTAKPEILQSPCKAGGRGLCAVSAGSKGGCWAPGAQEKKRWQHQELMLSKDSQPHPTDSGTKCLGSCLDANMQTESGLGCEGHVLMVAVLPAMSLRPYTLPAAQHRLQEHVPGAGHLLWSQLPPVAVTCPLCSILSLWRSRPPAVILAHHALSACAAVLHHQVCSVTVWWRLTHTSKSKTAFLGAHCILCKGQFASAMAWRMRRRCPVYGNTWRRVRNPLGDGQDFGTERNYGAFALCMLVAKEQKVTQHSSGFRESIMSIPVDAYCIMSILSFVLAFFFEGHLIRSDKLVHQTKILHLFNL